MLRRAWRWIRDDGYKNQWRERYPHVGFLNEPGFQRAPKGRVRLEQDLLFRDRYHRIHVIRKGYAYDGVTTGNPFVWLLIGHPMSPSTLRSSALHDWYCDYPGAAQDMNMSSEEIHDLFRDACLSEDGIASPRAFAMWIVTRVFGPRWKRPPIWPTPR